MKYSIYGIIFVTSLLLPVEVGVLLVIINKGGQRRFRFISLYCFALYVIWLTFEVGCLSTKCYAKGFAGKAIAWIGLGHLVFFYIVMLVESYRSDELQYVTNIMKETELNQFIDNLQRTKPKKFMSITYSHDEERSSNNGSRTVNVVTHQESAEFQYVSCRDVTETQELRLDASRVTRVKLSKKIQFADQQTGNKFNSIKTSMIEMNRGRDELIKFTSSDVIDGFKEHITAPHKGEAQWWINPYLFWLAATLSMTWVYRLIFNCSTTENKLTIKKVISVLPEEQSLNSLWVLPYPSLAEYNTYAPPVMVNPIGLSENRPPPSYEASMQSVGNNEMVKLSL